MTLKISALEVHPVRDMGDHATIANSDAEADFFGLFGLVEGEVNDFYIAVGDYPDRSSAELARELLDNKKCSLPPQL